MTHAERHADSRDATEQRADRTRSTTESAPASTVGVLAALQRSAGNRAVAALLGGGTHLLLPLQRQQVDQQEADTRTPEQRVDAATWNGFSTWWASADADATEAAAEADEVGALLSSPYRERLGMLTGELVGSQNLIANGVTALRAGRDAPWLTADPIARAEELEQQIEAVRAVSDAWRAVLGSGLLELMAAFGEAQLRLAERLRDELAECRRELDDLTRVFNDPKVREAAIQFGVNAAISVAVIAISVANPVVGIAVSVGAAATQLTLDALLGPSEPGPETFTAAGASVAGSAAENLSARGTSLRTAGRRLGVAGAIAASALDANEVYQAHRARLVRLGQRMDQIARQLERLRPLLLYPRQARALIAGLRAHATRLREEGQLVLSEAGQL
ncbi:MAG TPA: hypothetical protein VIK95_14190 [Egibacteraceae bacterium]